MWDFLVYERRWVSLAIIDLKKKAAPPPPPPHQVHYVVLFWDGCQARWERRTSKLPPSSRKSPSLVMVRDLSRRILGVLILLWSCLGIQPEIAPPPKLWGLIYTTAESRCAGFLSTLVIWALGCVCVGAAWMEEWGRGAPGCGGPESGVSLFCSLLPGHTLVLSRARSQKHPE